MHSKKINAFQRKRLSL